ncbi:MAG: hypothetical protein V4683_11195 [Bacteroidota bacterium]
MTGDTLTGEIDNKDWSESPAEIRFRKLNELEIRNFNAYQTKAFGINSGVVYQSFQTALYQTKEEGDIPSYKTVADTTVFMEVISKGKLTLFEFIENGEKSRFFAKNENGNLIQLIYHSVYNSTNLIHNRLYQNQLADLTNTKSIPIIEYQIYSLKAFVEKFNGTKSIKKKSVKIQMGLGGTYYQNLIITRIGTNETLANFESNLKPTFGVNFQFPFSKKFNSFSFDLGALFTSYSANKVSGDSFLSVKKINTNNLFLNIGFRYMFYTKTGFRPYLGFGAGINETIGDNFTDINEKKVKLPIRPYNGGFEFNIHPARIFAKAGLRINDKIDAEFRFDRIPQYNSSNIMNGPLNSYGLLVFWSLN